MCDFPSIIISLLYRSQVIGKERIERHAPVTLIHGGQSWRPSSTAKTKGVEGRSRADFGENSYGGFNILARQGHHTGKSDLGNPYAKTIPIYASQQLADLHTTSQPN